MLWKIPFAPVVAGLILAASSISSLLYIAFDLTANYTTMIACGLSPVRISCHDMVQIEGKHSLNFVSQHPGSGLSTGWEVEKSR